eukprot:g18445.t1
MRVAYLVTKQSLVYQCDVKHCITCDNIPILVRATLMLRVMGDAEKGEDPSLVRKFVYEVGVRGLEAQLVNAVAEAIRVMARGTQHDAVYALTSGAVTIGGHPRPSKSPPSPTPVALHTPANAERTAGKRATKEDVERARRGLVKRVKVAPDPDWSDPESFAEPSVASTTSAAADGASTAARHTPPQQQQQPQRASSPSFPEIQRGLRASRIVPAIDADAAAEKQQKRPPEEGHGAPPSSLFMDDRRRVYPSEELSNDDSQGTRRGLCGGGDVDSTKEEGARTRIPSRPPPAATNLDLSSNPVAASSNSNLPPLELEVAPWPSLPPSPASTTSGRAMMTRKHDGQKAYKPDDGIESNLPGARTSRDEGDRMLKAGGKSGEGRAPSVASAASVRDKEAADLIALGHRHAEEIRDRLNRTFSPQGIEITTVMIRSTELPSHMAEQMSGRTMNASLAEEQRAVKKSEMQKVRLEGEVMELRQRLAIERSLVMRDGTREVEKAKDKLRRLRAQAIATLRAIAAESDSSVQRLASEAQLEVSQSCLKEAASANSKRCASDRVAGIVVAEASAFRVQRASEVDLEEAQNNARARGLVDAAEGDSAPMLRAARVDFTDNKRLQVLGSLAKNELALVVTSPLVSEAPSSSNKVEHTNALSALLLGEAGFKAQILQDAPPPPRPPPAPQNSPPSPSSPAGGKRNGSSKLSISSTPSLVVRRRRMELGAQLLLARALGGGGGRGDSSPSCSLFAVRLNAGRAWAAAVPGNRARKTKVLGGASRDCVGVDGVGGGGSGSGVFKRGEPTRGRGNEENNRKTSSAEEGEDAVVGLLDERGRNGSRRRARAEEAIVDDAAVAVDCELCVLRNGIP